METVNISKFQFTNPVIIRFDLLVNDDYSKSTEKESNMMPMEMSVSKKISPPDRKALVVLSVKIGNETSQCPYCIHTEMQANFKWEEGISDTVVSRLLDCNAPALLLGYIRPHIANITSASRYGVINIPFMDFTSIKAEESQSGGHNADSTQ